MEKKWFTLSNVMTQIHFQEYITSVTEGQAGGLLYSNQIFFLCFKISDDGLDQTEELLNINSVC